MLKKFFVLLIGIIFSFVAMSSFSATLQLPNQIIALSSPLGNELFNRSYIANYFWPLDLQFVTQENRTYCSIASSVMVLNALNITAPTDPIYAPYKIFTQDNFFTPKVEKVLPSSLVKKQGATLEQISRALTTFPVSTKTIYANEVTVNQFRTLAKNVIDSDNGYIIVDFLRSELGEVGGGHISPLAAYDKSSDRFLMLDVARYRYPPVWVKTQDLWNAMHTIDPTSHLYRGFIIVSNMSMIFQVNQDQIIFNSSTVESATINIPEKTTDPYGVYVKLKTAAADKMSYITQKNIGQQANIILNGKVISSVMLRSELGGNFFITGLTKEQANEFINSLGLTTQ